MNPRHRHRPMSVERRSSTLARAALAIGCLTFVAAACGGSDGGTTEPAADGAESAELVIDASAASAGSTSDDPVTDEADATPAASSDQTDEERALAFAGCMRDEGVDWPDPTTNADGSVDPLGGRSLQQVAGADPSATQAAADVCRPLLDGASFLPGGGDGFDAETQDTFVEFASCLRSEGLDVTDPDFSSGAGAGVLATIFPADFDPDDPDNAAAIDACSALFAGSPLAGQGG